MNAPYTNRALASSAALISGCLGVYTAVVWLVDRWHLATLGPDQIPMAPMTAAMFVLLALALGVRIYRPADRTTESASLACALLVTLICALELTRPVWGWSLPWDHWRSTLVTKTGELEIGRITAMRQLMLAQALLFCLGLAVVLTVGLLAIVFWDQRVLVVALAAAAVWAVALGLFLALRRTAARSEPLFAASLAELQEDLRQLRAATGHGRAAD